MRTSFVTWNWLCWVWDSWGTKAVYVLLCPWSLSCHVHPWHWELWSCSQVKFAFLLPLRAQTGKIKKGRRRGESAESHVTARVPWDFSVKQSWHCRRAELVSGMGEDPCVMGKDTSKCGEGSHMCPAVPHTWECMPELWQCPQTQPLVQILAAWALQFQTLGSSHAFFCNSNVTKWFSLGSLRCISPLSAEWGEPRHRPWNELEHAVKS